MVGAFGRLVDCGNFLPEINLEDLFRTIDDGISWLEQIGKTEWLGLLRLRKGLLFLRQYKKEQALQELEVALASAYRNPEFVSLISCKLSLADALCSHPRPEFERSQRLIEEVLEEAIYPDELYEGYLLQARVLHEKNLRQKTFSGALTSVQKAIEIARTLQSNPFLSDAYVVRSSISIDMEHYQDALADLNEAVLLDASGRAILTLRGDYSVLMERYEEALADFNRALALSEPNPDPWALGRRGELYTYMGSYQEALVQTHATTSTMERGGS